MEDSAEDWKQAAILLCWPLPLQAAL